MTISLPWWQLKFPDNNLLISSMHTSCLCQWAVLCYTWPSLPVPPHSDPVWWSVQRPQYINIERVTYDQVCINHPYTYTSKKFYSVLFLMLWIAKVVKLKVCRWKVFADMMKCERLTIVKSSFVHEYNIRVSLRVCSSILSLTELLWSPLLIRC